MDGQPRILESFRTQSAGCEQYGSPFTAELIAQMAADLSAGGPVAELVGDWPTNPRADALALRLCGALHFAALTGSDRALAAEYPAQQPHWNMGRVWPLARAFLAREHAWVARFIQSAPQTNEVRRSIALLAGFLHFASGYDGPLDLLEIGASAGLNLHWDRFSYRTSQWRWGREDGVVVDTDWRGPPPPLRAALRVRSRAGCDLNPLDMSDRTQRLQLRSYIWADQLDRLARFDAAADLAVASGAHVERADAAQWLAERLRTRATDAATVIYHSVFLQYPSRDARAAITHAIEAAGAATSAQAPLAWIRLEPEALLTDARDSVRFLVDITTWPHADRRTLAITDGHVRFVECPCP